MTVEIHCGDCLEFMRSQPGKICDLALFSPPYEAARTYGIDFALRGEAFIAWMKERIIECLRITRGPVVCVVEGQTRQYSYSATPLLLAADLKRAGVTLRKPPIYRRVGIPGGGGPDWLRNDYEFCIVATNGGRLPWSDNTACGHKPKWAPGGEMSHRGRDGSRRNEFGMTDGSTWRRTGSGKIRTKRFRNAADGTVKGGHDRDIVKIANPGNVIQKFYTAREVAETIDFVLDCVEFPVGTADVIDCVVGGGTIGSRLAHENEAPFPESLAEPFIRSVCPPGGVVFDPFCGSGTTLAVAKRLGRNAIGVDVRQSQVDLSWRRVAEVVEPLERMAAALAAF